MSDIFTDTEIQESSEPYDDYDYSSESYDDNYSKKSYDDGNCPPGHYISIAHGGKVTGMVMVVVTRLQQLQFLL